MRRPIHVRLLAACVLLGGCEYDLDVGPPWEIDAPRVIAVRMVVVEPAPIWEQRLGFDDQAPISEALPGDVVELQALAVDGEGAARAPESLDALWFQCGFEGGPSPEADCVLDVLPCDSLDEWTTDAACEIGRGGALAFTFPALGPYGFEHRRMPILALIGREPGTDVERCREQILANTTDYSTDRDGPLPPVSKYEGGSPACTLVEARVLIGPRWVLPFMAADLGFEPEVPLEQIPYLTQYQPANRAPAPGQPPWFDAGSGAPLEGSPPRVRPGQRIMTTGPIWRAADRQLYAIPKGDDGSFVFLGRREGIGALYFASGPILELAADGNDLQLVVDPQPETSSIRVVMIVGDRRKDDVEYGTVGMLVSELEVDR